MSQIELAGSLQTVIAASTECRISSAGWLAGWVCVGWAGLTDYTNPTERREKEMHVTNIQNESHQHNTK